MHNYAVGLPALNKRQIKGEDWGVAEFGDDAGLVNELLTHSLLHLLFAVVVVLPHTKHFYHYIA